MALRAIIFDYGMVLTGPQDPEAYATLLRITGLPLDRFESLYWADRHAYDEGKLTGLAFWQKLLREAGLHMSPATIDELNLWDARMWTTQNPAMVAWQQQLKRFSSPLLAARWKRGGPAPARRAGRARVPLAGSLVHRSPAADPFHSG